MKRMLTAALLVTLAIIGRAALCPGADPANAKSTADEILAAAGVHGGLCVHLGCGNGRLTAALAADGRFLVHGLEPDAAAADAAIRFIRSSGIYGQAWVEHYAEKRLPYAENLVNLIVVDDPARTAVPREEIMRVLVPGGAAVLGPGAKTVVRKPWPAEMDEWSHPRHGPDGNAVSHDSQVGPPRRVRWLAGPMHEASNIVTAGGRFYYAGAIARDAFNGLRLWETKLDPTPMRLGYPATSMRGSVLPVAAADMLYVVTGGKLQALDGATGRRVHVYDAAGSPQEILCVGTEQKGSGTPGGGKGPGPFVLVTCDSTAVKALDAAGGRLLWSYGASLPGGAVAGDGAVFVFEREARTPIIPSGPAPALPPAILGVGPVPRAIVRLDLATGKPAWRQTGYDWAAKARQLCYHQGLLVCEVSTFTNDRPGNGIHVLDAGDGRQLWEYLYEPGQNHYVQGRALVTEKRVWVLVRNPADVNSRWDGHDLRTGSVIESYRAGPNHCYPPVATGEYLVGEEMSFTSIATGQTDANRIAKGACARDAGFILANGLLYVAPKHCACYPMLKGYTALAPAKPGDAAAARDPEPADFAVERGPAFAEPDAGASGQSPPAAAAAPNAADEWPCYRADMWRSASAAAAVPAKPDVLWTADIGGWPKVALLADWKDNLFVRGPVTPPVVAGGLVFVAQPDGHRVVALDARTGKMRWDFTANGRIDTPPTIARGLCLFGTSSGHVYCLRAADGKLAWRLRVAPNEERIISFGQLESPWPVPGSVLVVGGTAYVAAGRHPFADGGIRVLAFDPPTGKVKWVKTITSLPMKNFYGGAGFEFDPFDLLVAEARRPGANAEAPQEGPGPSSPCITLSRWQIDPATGDMTVAWHSGFQYARTGGAGVMAPRGLWTYGPRMDYIASGPKPNEPDFVATTPRPLAAFRAGAILASSEDRRRLFRRDFTAETIAAFDDTWFSQRTLPKKDKPGDRNRAERLMRGAAWTCDVFDASDRGQGIAAVVLAGDTVLVAGTKGRLLAFAADDGRKLAERDLAPPVWDGLAAAGGCLYVSTSDGKVICLGLRAAAPLTTRP